MLRQSRSLLFILAFMIIISASIVITSCGQKSDSNSATEFNENVVTETANHDAPEEDGDATDDATTEENAEDEVVARGEEIVMQKCIACHGGNLEGARGPELRTISSRLSQEEIEAILRDGNKTMPPNLLQSEEDVVAAAEFLMTLQ